MSFSSIREIQETCTSSGLSFGEVVLQEQMNEMASTREEVLEEMHNIVQAMTDGDNAYDPRLFSASKLSGTDGAKLEKALQDGNLLSGSFSGLVMVKALKMMESNACMKCIVAAPTAGSCGILPAVLLSCREMLHTPDETLILALFVAGGVGQVIASRASIAGATGGCQAEVGSASAMAAAALTFIRGGDATAIGHGAAMALKGMLGLVCDPVAGLVEVPCVKRNVFGAIQAVTAADMAMAGICSRIPADEVIDAMAEIGHQMPACLKETAEGGLAMTPTGQKIANKLSLKHSPL